jgi:uncharacterized protein involved in exopolysaccharide biosynthesis
MWLVLGTVVVGAAVMATHTALFREYQASLAVRPEPGASGAALASVAAQLGITGVGLPLEGGLTPDYLVALARSRSVLTALAETEFLWGDPAQTQPSRTRLIDILAVPDMSARSRMQRAVRELEGRVTAGRDAQTAIVWVKVRAPDPGLAESVARRVLELVETFNRERYQSAFRGERVFAEQRLLEVRTALEDAERELQTFLERNRDVGAPRLRFAEDQLRRRVEVQQQIYLTLAKAVEQARIEELRNTPALTVVEEPAGSARWERRVGASAVTGAAIGLAIAGLLLLLLEYWGMHQAARTPDYAEFVNAGKALWLGSRKA